MSNRYLPYRWLALANEAYEITEGSIDRQSDPSVLIVGAGNRTPYTLALILFDAECPKSLLPRAD